MSGWQGQHDKERVRTYVPKVEDSLLFQSAELTLMSCKGSAMNSVYFKDPREKRSPRGSIL